MKPAILLVHRLQALWDPLDALCLIQDTSWLEAVRPLAKYRVEDRRGLAYHQRRIRYFVDLLRAGQELDPISVDNACNGMHIYPIPVLLDGNHRLIASIIEKRETIPAHYGGRIDLLRYLEGKRKSLPV